MCAVYYCFIETYNAKGKAMKIFESADGKQVDLFMLELLNETGCLADGDMMILSQGLCMLQAYCYEPKTIVLEYTSDEPRFMNFSEIDIAACADEIKFVKAVAFDNAQEAKAYILQRASDEMMLNNF